MISYDRLFKLLKEKNISQYRLIKTGISNSTLERLKKDQYVNLITIDKLCALLDCDIEDIVEYKKSED
jgi:DNA-binding Xre family transcriptional regulator